MTLSPPPNQLIAQLIDTAFGPDVAIVDTSDANQGRGVFSQVTRVVLSGSDAGLPASVVIKTPATDDNGRAAVASGAFEREALAYTQILPSAPIASPRCYLAADNAFVLEDMGRHRAVDQLAGLDASDATSVVEALRFFHRHYAVPAQRGAIDVRRSTPGTLDPDALAAGLGALDALWASAVDGAGRAALGRLVDDRAEVVADFAAAGPVTLCHGDPRADNLVFGSDGAPIVFDWQQLAIQFGAADIAWLASTSLTTDTRRAIERDLCAAAGITVDDYRLGLALPGLAVLLLARRQTDDERSNRFIATSLNRITTALADWA